MFKKKKNSKKPYLSYDLGGYKYDFYYSEGNINDTYIEITEKSMRMWSMRIPGNTDIFGMLLYCAMELSSGRSGEGSSEMMILERYGLLMHLCSVTTFVNKEFTDGFLNTVNRFVERLDEKSKENAESVTEEEEKASQYIMEAMVRPHDSEEFKAAVSKELDKMLSEESTSNEEENG